MCRMPPCALRRARHGVAAVEFAIVLPFLCLAFLVTLDFCRVYYYSVTVSNCARNGAVYGSADRAHALDTSGIQAAARVDAGNLDSHQLQVASSADSSTSPSYVDVNVTYPFTTITQYPGIPTQTNLSRTVRMSVLPATPNFN